ncbi:MAG: sugar ABC transporter permease [Candidatus Atribacteria bacterium]|nr:sugar ABC transporter permease [Candidatus Atribacteria bacterium]
MFKGEERVRAIKVGFIVPGLLYLMLMAVFPMIWSFSLSFQRWKAATASPRVFVGLRNFYTIFFEDPRFWNSLRFTVFYVLIVVVIELFLGLLLAYILNEKIRFRNFFRVVFLFPMAAPPIGIAFMWRMLLNPDAGIMVKIMNSLGINVVRWLTDAKLTPFVLMSVDIWEWTPFMFLGLLAAFQSLPVELYDAAQVDGASRFQTFRFITFPLLLPIVVTLLLLRAIDAFKLFELVFGITGGGPGSSTESLSYYIYTVGFQYFDLGYACSLSWIFLGIVLLISNFLLQRLRKEV